MKPLESERGEILSVRDSSPQSFFPLLDSFFFFSPLFKQAAFIYFALEIPPTACVELSPPVSATVKRNGQNILK